MGDRPVLRACRTASPPAAARGWRWLSAVCMALGAVCACMPNGALAQSAAQPSAAAPMAHAHGAAATAASGAASGSASRLPRRRPPPLAAGAAFAPDGSIWLAGLDASQRLSVQAYSATGSALGPPRTIETGSDKIAADGENRPKIAFGPRGWVVITYTEPLARPYTGQIRMLRSEDGGRSFSPPFTVHADRQEITHRFESVAFDAKGTLHTLWIDKRDLEAEQARLNAAVPAAPAASSAREGRRQRPATTYRGAAIYRNESTDGGRSFGPDIKLADHSCECCRIALAPAPDGSLVALWRHVFAPNERDHAFAPVRAVSVAEASNPARSTQDHWAIDACPHHGPGLAPSSAGGYHAVWFGDRSGVAAVRYGRLAPDGTPHGPVRTIPDAAAEHAAVASAGRQVAIVWRAFDGQATLWRAWLSRDDGASFTLRDLGRTTADNDHPLLLQQGERIVALWRTTEGVRIERLAP